MCTQLGAYYVEKGFWSNVKLMLTVNKDGDGELVEVGGRHHHAGEGVLVHQRGLGNQQVVLVVDADPRGIAVCGLDCSFLLVLFDQQIPGGTVGFFLKKQTGQ